MFLVCVAPGREGFLSIIKAVKFDDLVGRFALLY